MLSYLNSLKLFIGEDSERGSCAIRAFWCYQAQRRAPTVPWTVMKFSERDLENFWVEKGKTLLPSSLNKYSFDCCKALIKLWSCEKVDFDNFCHCSHYFMEKWVFRDHQSANPADVLKFPYPEISSFPWTPSWQLST